MRLNRSDWYFLNVFVRFLTILCLMSGVTMAARETRVFTRSHVVSHRSRRANEILFTPRRRRLHHPRSRPPARPRESTTPRCTVTLIARARFARAARAMRVSVQRDVVVCVRARARARARVVQTTTALGEEYFVRAARAVTDDV